MFCMVYLNTLSQIFQCLFEFLNFFVYSYKFRHSVFDQTIISQFFDRKIPFITDTFLHFYSGRSYRRSLRLLSINWTVHTYTFPVCFDFLIWKTHSFAICFGVDFELLIFVAKKISKRFVYMYSYSIELESKFCGLEAESIVARVTFDINKPDSFFYFLKKRWHNFREKNYGSEGNLRDNQKHGEQNSKLFDVTILKVVCEIHLEKRFMKCLFCSLRNQFLIN